MYNWGIRKNTNKVKNPVEGKFLADLDWMRIIVNPVNGSVLCMGSKCLQDLGVSNVILDEVYGILVAIYAWKFTPREGLASIPKNDHDGGLSENIDDTCSESAMTGGNVSECTDELAYMYEWEDMAARDLGLRTCAASPKVDCPKGDYPKMPCVPDEERHCEKVVKVAKIINAMVSRLIDQGELDLSAIREYYDVAREAKQKNEEVRMARAHGIIVEKHSQLLEEDPRRKYKGRGVVLGNQIKNQTSDAALFQDLGNSPATFEASRWADFLGCLDGAQMADAVQAYIQATLRGTPCWIASI